MDQVLTSFWAAHSGAILRAQRNYLPEKIRYRYPALSQTEQEIEAYLQSIEREEKLKQNQSGQWVLYEPGMFDDIQSAEDMHQVLFSITKKRKTGGTEESASIDDGIRFSITDRGETSKNEYEEAFDFEAEQERIKKEIRERIDKLRELGVDELVLRKLFEKEDTLSRLVITRDYRILLPDYHNIEIEMTPLPKAVFLLYLRHEEGISFKFLSDYQDELRDIYMRITDRVQYDVIDKSIQDICDPTQNAINEKCSRIREAFVNKFDARLAQHYFVTGKRGDVKRIQIQRELVVWES